MKSILMILVILGSTQVLASTNSYKCVPSDNDGEVYGNPITLVHHYDLCELTIGNSYIGTLNGRDANTASADQGDCGLKFNQFGFKYDPQMAVVISPRLFSGKYSGSITIIGQIDGKKSYDCTLTSRD